MIEIEKYTCEKCKRGLGPFSVVEVENGVECEVCGDKINFEEKEVCDGCFNEVWWAHEKERHNSIDLV